MTFSTNAPHHVPKSTRLMFNPAKAIKINNKCTPAMCSACYLRVAVNLALLSPGHGNCDLLPATVVVHTNIYPVKA